MNHSCKLTPRVDGLEGKVLLSGVPWANGPNGVLPVTTVSIINRAQHSIDTAAGTYAKTHNAAQFDMALERIANTLPYGNAQLYPTFQADEAIYNPATAGSGVQMVQQLHADLTAYVQNNMNSTFYVRPLPQFNGSVGTVLPSGVHWANGPNGVLPVTSARIINRAQHSIDTAAGTYAKTHNAAQFNVALVRIANTLPYGNAQLYPTFQADEAIYDPATAGSGVQMVQQLHADLTAYVQNNVNSTFYVR